MLEDRSNAAYAPVSSGAGYLLFWRSGTLMAQSFDSNNLRLSGSPFPVAEEVGYRETSHRALFSVSENGVLAFGSSSSDNQLVWFSRSGLRLGMVGEPGLYIRPVLSPDEKHVALDRLDPQRGTSDIWLLQLQRDGCTRLTFDPKDDIARSATYAAHLCLVIVRVT